MPFEDNASQQPKMTVNNIFKHFPSRDDNSSQAESFVVKKSVRGYSQISKASKQSGDSSKGEPLYPQNLVLQTPTLPPSKSIVRGRVNPEALDFGSSNKKPSGRADGRNSIYQRSSSQRDLPGRVPSPDSVAFDVVGKFMDLESPKNSNPTGKNIALRPRNGGMIGQNNTNSSDQQMNQISDFGSRKQVGISKIGQGSRRNSLMHQRIGNKITPIIISKNPVAIPKIQTAKSAQQAKEA